MDNWIRDFNNLSISKKKPSKRHVKPQTKLQIPGPQRVLIDPTVLKINQSRLPLDGEYCKVSKVLTYIYLDRNSDEFIDLKILFAESNLRVKSVRKVDNPYLKKAFELKRHLQYGGKKPTRLFHGTKEKYIDNICTYNFDWRYGGQEKGHRHGKGVNFSPSAYFATFFCDRKMKRVLIMADVLIDKVKPGDINTVVPPRGADTTTGKNGSVFVKFYDNEFYPKYVVKFEMMSKTKT